MTLSLPDVLKIRIVADLFDSSLVRQNLSPYRGAVSSIDELQRQLAAFRDERNWQRFHDPKSLAAALGAEVGELLEQVMWLSPDELGALSEEQAAAIRDEVADIVIFAVHLANSVGFDLEEAIQEKLTVVAQRIPPDSDAPPRKQPTG